MTAQAEKVVEAAMSLSADERVEVAERLMATLSAVDESDAGFDQEIRSRIEESERDPSCMIPGDEVFRKLRERRQP